MDEHKFGNLTLRRPSKSLTDAEWQIYFEAMRDSIQPSNDRIMQKPRLNPSPDEVHVVESHISIINSQLGNYCDFINSILKTIRSGHDDYCYFIYQVADLLRYERDRLRSEYLPDDGCIRVWLSRSSG